LVLMAWLAQALQVVVVLTTTPEDGNDVIYLHVLGDMHGTAHLAPVAIPCFDALAPGRESSACHLATLAFSLVAHSTSSPSSVSGSSLPRESISSITLLARASLL